MMNTNIKNGLLLILCFLFFNVAAEPEWEKKKDKDGIVIYTRSVDDFPMDEFKAILTLENTNLNKVLEVIMDIDNYTKWIPDCREAKVLLKNDKYHSIHYVAMNAPWPVTNRDGIYEFTTRFYNNDSIAQIDLQIRGDYLKEKEDFVRLKNGSGYWKVEQNPENLVTVTYQYLGDPGGKVPTWLVNSFVVSNPYETLINLRNLVGKR